MTYDLIIIGAGAAGLFAGASLPSPIYGLILEKGTAPGRKLLLSGSGQCNLTHGGNIKEFIPHYGENGTLIRSILYQFNNQSVIDFFQKLGIALYEREDGKVFPKSLRAQDVLNGLVKRCTENGLEFQYSSPVTAISIEGADDDRYEFAEEASITYTVHCQKAHYRAKKIIIATGGFSYPKTGSDGRIFPALMDMGFEVKPAKPSLVPIYTKDYPYKELAGVAFDEVVVTVSYNEKRSATRGALLFAHDCFSGPAILNCSRYAFAGKELIINYFPAKSAETMYKELTKTIQGNPKQLITVLYEYFNTDPLKSPAVMPKRFLELICRRIEADPAQKSSQIQGIVLKAIVGMIAKDRHSISGLGGYHIAMVTVGGVSLHEVDRKTLEANKYPGIYFAGEVLDVDGDTGGYNLQFAFSSGHVAAQQILGKQDD